MKNNLKVVFVIIGTIIGAGFASGKEIYVFFLKYGKSGLIGIIISSIMFGIIIYKILKKMLNDDISDYNEFLENCITQNRVVLKIIKLIINSFLLASFFIMIAGFTSFIYQEYEFPKILSSVIFCIICYITLLKNAEGMIKVNNILVPILIIFIIHICTINVDYGYGNLEKCTNDFKYIISSLLYSSYNSIILIPVIINMKKLVVNNNKNIKTINKNIFIICIMSVIALFTLAITIFLALSNSIKYCVILELPLSHIIQHLGKFYKFIYGFIITTAIFTSTISSGYSFLSNVENKKIKYKTSLLIICLLAIPISQLGFSFFIEKIYPIFGILGLIQIVYLLKK